MNLLVAMNRNLNLAASILLLCLLTLFHLRVLEDLFGFSRGVAQYSLIVPFVFALALFSYSSYRIPRYALVLTLFCSGIMGLAFLKLNSKTSQHNRVLFSPFLKDANQVQSIRFQDLFAKDLKQTALDVEILNLPNPVSNLQSAKKLFSEYVKDTVLVAGSSRWLKLYFSSATSEILDSNSDYRLGIVNWISSIGLSDSDSAATREFVLRIVAAHNALSNNSFIEAETSLVEAASVLGKWTTPVHRAYPLWLLGTLYLHKFNSTAGDRAYLICALDYLSRARKFIHNKDNPELLAAVLNNRAIAHYYSYIHLGKKDYKKKALRDLRVAAKSKPKLVDAEAWAMAKENLWNLNSYTALTKKTKKNKNKKGKINALVS